MAKSGSGDLEARIRAIVSEAATAIAAAVRQDVATRISLVIGVGGAPGRRVAVGAASAGKSATNAVRPQKSIGRRRRKSGPDAALLDRLLAFIKQKPNLRSEAIRKQLGIDAADSKAALAYLRANGKVRTKGDRRTTTYTVA